MKCFVCIIAITIKSVISGSGNSAEEEGETEKVSTWKKAFSFGTYSRSAGRDLEGCGGRAEGCRVSGQYLWPEQTSRGSREHISSCQNLLCFRDCQMANSAQHDFKVAYIHNMHCMIADHVSQPSTEED